MRKKLLAALLLISASVQAAPIFLECKMVGNKSNANQNSANEAVSETFEVQVDEDNPEVKIITLKGLSAIFIVVSGPIPFASFKAVGRDRSTKDVWDLVSKLIHKEGVQDTAIRINRRTGAISATNHTQLETGFWTKFSAKGNCVASKDVLKF